MLEHKKGRCLGWKKEIFIFNRWSCFFINYCRYVRLFKFPRYYFIKKYYSNITITIVSANNECIIWKNKRLSIYKFYSLKKKYGSLVDKIVKELEYEDGNGVQVQEIIVKEKEEQSSKDIIQQPENFEEEHKEIENELEILREQNKSKELDLEGKKLVIEEMKLKLKMHEQGIIQWTISP